MFSNCQQFWWWNQATDLHSYIFIYSKLTLVIRIANIEQRTTSVSLCTYTGSSCLTIRSDVTSHAIPDTVYLPCIQNWFELTWTVHSQLSRWWWSNGRNWCNASSSRTGKSHSDVISLFGVLPPKLKFYNGWIYYVAKRCNHYIYMHSFLVIDLYRIAYEVCINVKQSRHAFLPKMLVLEKPYWKSRGQMVSHRKLMWRFHWMQMTKHTSD